jgi:hypothetical protein
MIIVEFVDQIGAQSIQIHGWKLETYFPVKFPFCFKLGPFAKREILL